MNNPWIPGLLVVEVRTSFLRGYFLYSNENRNCGTHRESFQFLWPIILFLGPEDTQYPLLSWFLPDDSAACTDLSLSLSSRPLMIFLAIWNFVEPGVHSLGYFDWLQKFTKLNVIKVLSSFWIYSVSFLNKMQTNLICYFLSLPPEWWN